MSVQHFVSLVETDAELFDSLPGRTSFTHHFCADFNCICSRPEATSDVLSSKFVGPVVADKWVKFGDPRLNRSRENPP